MAAGPASNNNNIGAVAPLVDDSPRHVGGLAVKVRLGIPETRYQIGTRLQVAGSCWLRCQWVRGA